MLQMSNSRATLDEIWMCKLHVAHPSSGDGNLRPVRSLASIAKTLALAALSFLLFSSMAATQVLRKAAYREFGYQDEPSPPKSVRFESEGSAPSVAIPRLPAPPSIEDFYTMQPAGSVAPQMAKVDEFIQREPHDDAPPSQPTDVYLGYDHKNLYVVFVCHDDPRLVRARKSRREDLTGDDTVAIMLDTFRDRRRAYEFDSTPLGIQWDAIWTEQSYEETNGNFDESWDALWYSKGKITSGGYVVWMAIPFRSLRFPTSSDQTWGLILIRNTPRLDEKDFWPRVTMRKEGRLAQAATARGLDHISPGRNIQLIPYGLLNSFHSLDTRDSNFVHFDNRATGGTFGLDAKVILKDSLVLDATANPDFSQVESDDAQVTVNQRFEVFFPEKRPFFLENADYFRTPINLFFSRRIVNPSGGLRLTGKVGPYSLGFLSADDRGPGLTVVPSDSLFKTHSFFNVGRVSRDIAKQSTIGAIFTDWEYPAANSFNRVGGLDSHLKFTQNWSSTLQAVVSSTQDHFGAYSSGSAFSADLDFSGKHFAHSTGYRDYSPGFVTQPGFVNRVDIRTLFESASYRFRPTKGPVVAWGPSFEGAWAWDHTGLRLDANYYPTFNISLKRQTQLAITAYGNVRERLRPKDYPDVLTNNTDYPEHSTGVSFQTTPVSQLTLGAQYFFGDAVNFFPTTTGGPPCDKPCLAHSDSGAAHFTLRPFSALKIDTDYLFTRLRPRESNAAIFNNHVIRTKWNWQFNRDLSLRVILQYNATLSNSAYTSVATSKNFNTDVLFTYLLHPGTAVYVGYNTDFQNAAIDPVTHTLQPADHLTNDGRLFFVKVSYLLRF